MGSPKALKARKIEPGEVYAAPSAEDVPSFDDVVESEYFLEIQPTVTVAVELCKEVWVSNDRVVAALTKEFLELPLADSLITVGIHGLKELPCPTPKIWVAIVIVC